MSEQPETDEAATEATASVGEVEVETTEAAEEAAEDEKTEEA